MNLLVGDGSITISSPAGWRDPVSAFLGLGESLEDRDAASVVANDDSRSLPRSGA